MPTTTRKKTSTPRKPASRPSGAHGAQDQPQQSAAPQRARKWPSKGYDGPPPWELAQEHLDGHDEHRELVTGELPEPYQGPGAVTHRKPMLTQGTAGDDVAELARRLALLGYRENTITLGTNAADVLDQSVWNCIVRFQRDYGIREDERAFAGGAVPAQDLVDRHVGPYTWQALITLSDEAAEKRAKVWES